MKVRCLLVDDEARAHVVLKNYIGKISSLELVYATRQSVDAFNYLQLNQVDLLLLDVEMPELSGLELLAALDNPPKVIITSAHSEFALESYNFEVTDYLLKPIPFQRFLKAVNRVIRQLQQEEVSEEEAAGPERPAHLFVKEHGVNHKVAFEDILYVNSYGNYVRIFTAERHYLLAETMKNMDELLPDKDFIRVHKSYLVSIPHISKYQSKSLEVGGQKIPVGNIYRQALNQRLLPKS
jgi:DNA-binding LytR/AlgR family response regulator